MYDPWCDINNDGVINILDVVMITGKYAMKGTPITKTSVEYDSGWINITDKCGQYFNITHNLNSTNIMVDIQGKTIASGGVHQKHLGLTNHESGWVARIGGTDSDFALSVVQTRDGGFAFVGRTFSFGGHPDAYLVKTDASGGIQWNKTYGGTNMEFAYSLVQTTDGGFVLAGSRYISSAQGFDAYLAATDALGNLLWNKTYGGAKTDEAYSVVQTGDNGYAMAGYSRSFGASSDFYLVKTDSLGNLQWSRTYGGASEDCAYSMVRTNDNGFALAGSTSSFGAGYSDAYLIKTDASGNMQWTKTYGGTEDDCANCVIQTQDGGFALAGYTWSFGSVYSDVYLIKTNTLGNMQWNETYAATYFDTANSVVQTNDGGYIIAGSTGDGLSGDAYLVKTDASGNQLWNRIYEEESVDSEFYSVIETRDGRYVLAGDVGGAHESNNTSDCYLVETDLEEGLAWINSTVNSVTLYRGATDPYWNFVRVRIWKIKETP